MFAKHLEHVLAEALGKSDVSPIDLANIAERFESLRGYGRLPRVRANRATSLSSSETAVAILSLLKDPLTGEPTGMLIDNAMDLAQHLVPPPTDADTLGALEAGAQRSVRLGWTQLQIAGNSFHEVDLLCKLYAERRINLRLYGAVKDGHVPVSEIRDG